jgi:hypothetical protein
MPTLLFRTWREPLPFLYSEKLYSVFANSDKSGWDSFVFEDGLQTQPLSNFARAVMAQPGFFTVF